MGRWKERVRAKRCDAVDWGLLRPRLHGSGQIFARTKTCTVPPWVYTEPAELEEFQCERLSVQVWDLKEAGQLFDRHGSIFVRTRVNTRTVQLFVQIAQLWPGIKCRYWSKLCTDPCKHHCNRICTDPCKTCKQAVQEQNSSVQKFVRTRVKPGLKRGDSAYLHSNLDFCRNYAKRLSMRISNFSAAFFALRQWGKLSFSGMKKDFSYLYSWLVHRNGCAAQTVSLSV